MTPEKFDKYTRKPTQVQPSWTPGIKTGGGRIHRLFGIENHQQLEHLFIDAVRAIHVPTQQLAQLARGRIGL